MAKISGGEIIARILSQENVDAAFGIIDGTYFGFYSNLKKHGIQLVSPRHETCAAHMAGAYARLTGKLGVCMASNGPGVANILPGVAVENGEGNRVLLLTSSRRVGIGYPDRGGTFQYFNQVGVIGNMAKWSASVPSFSRVAELTRHALRQCFTGRPGVVHLDVPEDILNGKDQEPAFLKPHNYRQVDPVSPSQDQVKQAAKMLSETKTPLIHAGYGVFHSGAFEQLKTVAELLQCPVVTSWAGRGAFPEDHQLAIPMIYVSSNNLARNLADTVLALGSRIGETDWWGKPPYWASPAEQKFIQVDIDPNFIGRNKPTDLPIMADAKVFLAALAEELPQHKEKIDLSTRKEMLTKVKKEVASHRAKLDKFLEEETELLHSSNVAGTCQEIFQDDSVLVIDGGNTAIWGNFFHEIRRVNTTLSTPKFGMLGAGTAQAIGAAVARPKSQVYCLTGDGAMGFHMQEIETAVRNKLTPIYLVFCDKQWGMVKMNQQFALRPIKTLIKKSLDADETINADFGEIEFDKLAQSMGAHGERISKLEELKPAIERSLESKKCSVIHIDVDPVKHMWAPNLIDFKNMHQEPGGK